MIKNVILNYLKRFITTIITNKEMNKCTKLKDKKIYHRAKDKDKANIKVNIGELEVG